MTVQSITAHHHGFPTFKAGATLQTQDGRHYILLQLAGTGTNSMAVVARCTQTSMLVIFKVNRLFFEGMCIDNDSITGLSKERSILERLGDHPNIVQCIPGAEAEQVMRAGDFRLAFKGYEFLKLTLHKAIDLRLSFPSLRQAIYDVLSALKHIHANGVVHADVKPDNIMVAPDGETWKLIDFGGAIKTTSLSKRLGNGITGRWFRAPELFLRLGSLFSEKIDLWSVGCTFAEGLTMQNLFSGENFSEVASKIVRVCGSFPDAMLNASSRTEKAFEKCRNDIWEPLQPVQYDPDWIRDNICVEASREEIDLAVDLLEKLLQIDPRKRLCAEEALCHPLFNLQN